MKRKIEVAPRPWLVEEGLPLFCCASGSAKYLLRKRLVSNLLLFQRRDESLQKVEIIAGRKILHLSKDSGARIFIKGFGIFSFVQEKTSCFGNQMDDYYLPFFEKMDAKE
ncbi:hypothetical protein AVEN_71490-1 [Araneus ventricosus]|uniref:Uncharacterized protein n=1 Tax=Araneus ventricosus TaxID=182803 RepID=A0A4Y2RPA0_ARAVE|nr:hypothetical protein AVEN_71490-1 [Araneus ventricosus]